MPGQYNNPYIERAIRGAVTPQAHMDELLEYIMRLYGPGARHASDQGSIGTPRAEEIARQQAEMAKRALPPLPGAGVAHSLGADPTNAALGPRPGDFGTYSVPEEDGRFEENIPVYDKPGAMPIPQGAHRLGMSLPPQAPAPAPQDPGVMGMPGGADRAGQQVPASPPQAQTAAGEGGGFWDSFKSVLEDPWSRAIVETGLRTASNPRPVGLVRAMTEGALGALDTKDKLDQARVTAEIKKQNVELIAAQVGIAREEAKYLSRKYGPKLIELTQDKEGNVYAVVDDNGRARLEPAKDTDGKQIKGETGAQLAAARAKAEAEAFFEMATKYGNRLK